MNTQRHKRFAKAAIAVLLATMICLPATSSLAQPQPVTAKAGLWYYVKAYDLSMRLPADWQVIDRHKGAVLSVVSPPENKADPFRENCSLAASTLTESVALSDYATAMKSDAAKNLDAYAELETGELQLAGQPALWWSYSHRWRFVTARVLAFMVMREQTAFVFSCTAQPARYADYKPQFMELAKSLRFGKVDKQSPAPTEPAAPAPAL